MARIAGLSALGLLLLALVAGKPSLAAPAGATDGDAAGFARARAWFEGLGYPDLKSLPLVRVWTGSYWSTTDAQGNRRVELEPDLGWLTSEDGDRFRVFTTELRIDRFRREEVSGRPEARVTYDRIDLAETVRDGLAALERLAAFEKKHDPTEARPSPIWKETDPLGDTRMVPPLRFKGFVLACACARSGQQDLALALWHRLAVLAPWPPKDSWNVLEDLKDAIGHEARRNLIIDLTHQEGTWEEHLAAHRRWFELFPGHAETEQVRSEIASLERTTHVATVRHQAATRAWGAMSDGERADDLVKRLSDPFAFLLEPIDGTLLATQEGLAVPPGEQWLLPQLIALGDAAVPRLIEALTDDRWTRSASWDGGVSKGFLRQEVYVERVADLALVALGAITGEDFSGQGRIGRRAFLRGPGESIVTKGAAAAAQAKARAWWAKHEKGRSPGK
jgi:hypothetical protein